MSPRSRRYVQSLVAVALLAPSLLLAAEPAAGKQIRVKMSLTVTGSYQHTGPKEIPKGSMYLPVKLALDNSYTTEFVVPAETILTGLQKTNPLDPTSQKEMDDYNAKVKAREDRIYHSADNLRKPRAPGGARPAGNPVAMPSAEMMAKIKACGTDQACKQQVAMEMMSQPMPSGPNAQVQADIQAISNMCAKKGKIGTKAYEQCMDAEGRKRSTVPASAADDEPEVPELPDRYLLYTGSRFETVGGVERLYDCKIKAHAKINESYTLGAISDGEGGGQYGEGSGTAKGEGDSDPKAYPGCPGLQAVFDTKTNLFWTNMAIARVGIQVATTNAAFGGVERPQPIDEWMRSVLLGASASGSKTQKFGFQTAKFTWSFVRE